MRAQALATKKGATVIKGDIPAARLILDANLIKLRRHRRLKLYTTRCECETVSRGD